MHDRLQRILATASVFVLLVVPIYAGTVGILGPARFSWDWSEFLAGVPIAMAISTLIWVGAALFLNLRGEPASDDEERPPMREASEAPMPDEYSPDDPYFRYRIEPAGDLAGFQIVRDDEPWVVHPSALFLGAMIDALLRGANERDALLIAKTIYERPDATYAERMMYFTATDSWRPSRDPYEQDGL